MKGMKKIYRLSKFKCLMQSNFIVDVGSYGIANIIVLLSGIVQTFIVPKYLSIEAYGYWRIFTLYLGYVGFLHFGFADGIFIRWLGQSTKDIITELKYSLKFLLLQQVIVISFCLIVVTFLKLNPVMYFIVSAILLLALITNIYTAITFALQAIKQFKVLSILTMFQTVSFLIGIILLMVLKLISLKTLIIWQIINTSLLLLISLIVVKRFQTKTQSSPSFHSLLNYGWENIKLGWYVLIGNFISVLFFSLDRLFTSSLFTVKEFAYYSLAASFLGIIYLLINTVGRVFLPYLADISKKGSQAIYPIGSRFIVLLWGVGLGLFFPVSKFVTWYLPQYTPCLPVLKILFCSVGFGGVINIVHSNYYKSNKVVKPYFKVGFLSIVLFIVLTSIGLQFHHTLSTIAIMTVISFGVWYLLNEYQLMNISGRERRDINKDLFVIIGLIVVFYCCALLPGLLYPMLAYYSLFCCCYYFFFRKTVHSAFMLLQQLTDQA